MPLCSNDVAMLNCVEKSHISYTGVFRKNAQGVLSENRFLTFIFLVQKNAPGRFFGKKILTSETTLIKLRFSVYFDQLKLLLMSLQHDNH